MPDEIAPMITTSARQSVDCEAKSIAAEFVQ
jgi:hypothetical protein